MIVLFESADSVRRMLFTEFLLYLLEYAFAGFTKKLNMMPWSTTNTSTFRNIGCRSVHVVPVNIYFSVNRKVLSLQIRTH